jgi:hypothetical protein
MPRSSAVESSLRMPRNLKSLELEKDCSSLFTNRFQPQLLTGQEIIACQSDKRAQSIMAYSSLNAGYHGQMPVKYPKSRMSLLDTLQYRNQLSPSVVNCPAPTTSPKLRRA